MRLDDAWAAYDNLDYARAEYDRCRRHLVDTLDAEPWVADLSTWEYAGLMVARVLSRRITLRQALDTREAIERSVRARQHLEDRAREVSELGGIA